MSDTLRVSLENDPDSPCGTARLRVERVDLDRERRLSLAQAVITNRVIDALRELERALPPGHRDEKKIEVIRQAMLDGFDGMVDRLRAQGEIPVDLTARLERVPVGEITDMRRNVGWMHHCDPGELYRVVVE